MVLVFPLVGLFLPPENPIKRTMNIGVIRETREHENRVALTPDVIKQLIKKGYSVTVEAGAGASSFFQDEDYQSAGASLATRKDALAAQVVLKVNAPTAEEISEMTPGAACISFLYAHTSKELVDALNSNRITSFSMDAVPRISRAQKMDALSSQANLAGYKAVLTGANHLNKIFPLLMTSAGTITPARVLIFGAGVAGLQAIATARRLGAVVEVSDVRPDTKEQVESLGGR